MQLLHKIERVYGTRYATFRVPTALSGDVFMSVSRSNFLNEDRSVVVVDAQKFLTLWRANPYEVQGDVQHGNADKWKTDRKYKDAEDGFSHGSDNPVPLAEIACDVNVVEHKLYSRSLFIFKKLDRVEKSDLNFIAFTNGITRTLWLLANGAAAFPVEVRTKQAERLQKLAGLPGGRSMTVADLIPEHELETEG